MLLHSTALIDTARNAGGCFTEDFTMDERELSPREKKILDFLRVEISGRGYPPTVREICTAVGIRSTSTVYKDMNRLEEKGFLKKDPSKPRAVMLTGDISSSHGTGDRNDGADRTDVIDVPVVGDVAAGLPITAEENIVGTMPVPSEYVRGTCFMLKVRGESMINSGIMDGDLVLVEQRETADNGDIVVALTDDYESEATVKTFYKEDDHIRLQPENDNMEPIIVKDVRIQGRVRGVFRFIG